MCVCVCVCVYVCVRVRVCWRGGVWSAIHLLLPLREAGLCFNSSWVQKLTRQTYFYIAKAPCTFSERTAWLRTIIGWVKISWA